MKLLRILAFLIILAPSVVFANKSNGEYKTYKNTTYGYSVKYPASRKVVDGAGDGSSIVFDDGNPAANHNNLTVGISENFYNAANLDELTKSYVELIQGSATGFPVGEPKVDIKNVKIQKIKAKKLTYLDNERITVSTIIFLKDDKIWSIGGPAQDKDFKRFISSFKLKKAKVAKKVKSAKSSATHQVLIQNFAFEPATLTVKKGETVEFIQKDSVQHTVSTDPHPQHTQLPGFDSELLSIGQKYAYTFDKVGTWTYHCSPHPFMKGTINVIE